MSVSYLQLVGGLSKSINVGRALTNQDISVQKKSLFYSDGWFFSPNSDRGG